MSLLAATPSAAVSLGASRRSPHGTRVDEAVLAAVSAAARPLNVDELVRRAQEVMPEARAVDIKACALSMVLQGSLAMNETWQVHAA